MGFIRTANVLILILCQHVANTCCWSCPLGWIERPDSVTCYRFWDARKMTWDSAQSTCQAYGGNLVQLNSKEEKKWIIEEVSKYPPSYEWWIGLRRNQENESLWQWIDGSFRNESNNNILWGSGEPNNFRDSEDCGEIWDNLLNDKDCRIPLQSICERPKESPLLCDVVHGWFDLTVAGADTACFKILDGVDSYADAEAACLKEESILARTESRDVLVALTAHLTSHAPASTFWLPYMLYTSGTPSWRFPGSDVDVTPQWWLAETPETQTLIDEKKLCAVVNASIDDNRNWSPVSCDSLNTAVCRKPIGDCPADYIRFLQWCVKVVDDQALTWWEARSFCNLRDTQLLRIKSSDMQYIVQKAEQFFSFNTSIWLGFAANGSDGWQWFDEIDSRNASFGDFENDKVESNIPSASHCGIVTANGTWSTADCGSTSVGTVCLGCAAGSRGDQCNGYREPGPGPTLNLLPKYVCPFGFTVNSADCYRKVPGGTVDWYTARGICAAEGAFLASPVSEEHRQYLRPIITEDTWTSLNDREMEGRYVWHDNTLMVGPGDWAANEPNNYEIGGTYSENCVLMRYTRDVTSRGRWRDVPCSFKAGVVCQKRAGYNIALGKVATNSSVAYKAIDGVIGGRSDTKPDLCAVLNKTALADPAWQLDLGVAYPIGTVIIHRFVTNSCSNDCRTAMSGFRVFLSNASNTEDPAFLVYTELSPTPQSVITIVLDPPSVGRFVRIDLPGKVKSSTLTLCEVEVLLYDGTRPTVLSKNNSNCVSVSTEWRGMLTHTVSGRECQLWSLDTPHTHNFNDRQRFANGEIVTEAKNYCRDPDGEGTPWCYTNDPGRRWEFCPVPMCTAGSHLPVMDKTVSGPCKTGWTEISNTGACVIRGQENLTFADSDSACRNEEALAFLPKKDGGVDDVHFAVNLANGTSPNHTGVSMLANKGNMSLEINICVAVDGTKFELYQQKCLDRLPYYCSTAERFTIYKTPKTTIFTVVPIIKANQFFVFEFRGFDGATVLLSNSSTGQKYEIRIGGNVFIQSYINVLDIKQNTKLYKTAIQGLYNATFFSGFWMSWSGSNIKVGKGHDIGRNVFMEVRTSNFIPETLGIGTPTGYEGEWKVPKEQSTVTSAPSSTAVAPDDRVNLAIGKRAYQSSTHERGAATDAVDGCTDGTYNNYCCTHTEIEDGPWWEVDLGGDFPIKEIVVYNRQDCCSERLAGFVTRISFVSVSTNDDDIVYKEDSQKVPPYVTRIPTQGRRGRFVQLSLPNKRQPLTLCEVEVILDSDVAKCEKGWHVAPTADKCYHVMRVPLAHTKAVEVCDQLEARIALPTAPEEELFLYSLLLSLADTPKAMWLPIQNRAGVVNLLPGVSTLTYKRWKAAVGTDSSAGQCGGVDLGNSTSSGSWGWYPCSEVFTVICEKREEKSTTAIVTLMSTTAGSTTKITTTQTALPRHTECLSNWQLNSKRSACYRLYFESLTFYEARDKCVSQGAKLASIENFEEQTFLKGYIEDKGGGRWYDAAWVGAIDQHVEGRWHWDMNEDIPWAGDLQWAPNQPDNWKGVEDCGTLRIGDNDPGKLNDLECDYKPAGYICKIAGSTTKITTTQTALPRHTECPSNWQLNPKRSACYRLYFESLTFSEARDKCVSRGAKLASIENFEEQTFLKGYIEDKGGGRWYDAAWVGAIDQHVEGRWHWDMNEDIPWAGDLQWAPNQPDNWKGVEDCGTLRIGDNDPGKLNDLECDYKPAGYICKIDLKTVNVSTTSPVSANNSWTAEYGPETSTKPSNITISTKVTTTTNQELPPLVNRFCGPGWEYDVYSDRCYRVSNFAGSFLQAKEWCGQYGGALVSISSPSEFVFIIGILHKYGTVQTRYWLGLTAGVEEGWRWMDGSPLAYFNWAPDEPNDKRCAFLITGPSSNFSQWATDECDQNYHFVCKKPGVKDEASITTTSWPTSGPLQQDTGLGCPQHGWKAYEKSCYLVVQDKTDWTQALHKCRRFASGADLASFKDELEMDFIWSTLDNDFYCNDIYTNSTKCQIWASRGECDNNPVWMATHCHKSCQLCMHNCRDTYGEQCLNWARIGECNKNPVWMAANCADSCGVCKGAPSRGYWLGMQRSPGQRLYSWSDRSPVTYTLWHKGEPSALDNTGGSCVGLYVPINQMNDGSCSDILDGYVCKQPMQRLSNASAIDNSLGCNGTQLAYKDMCFKYIHSPMTWNKAKTYCETTERGSLVVIKNRYVQAFVASELHNQIEDVWIGLSINGSLPSKLQWAAADHHIRFTNLEAADINSLGNTGCFALQQKKPIGLWKEYNCSTKLPFLCQKLRNGFSTAPAMPTVPTTNVATKCDDSWTQFQGVCYKLSSRDHGLKTWSVANDICTHYGGNLVYIGSQDVQNFIYSFVNGDIFLGLHDKGNEGVFAWSNGKPMVYTNWVSGEPNNYGVNEDCASMVKYNGQWNDDSCHTTKAFVCEIPLGKPVNKEAVPDFSKLEECNTTSYGNSNMKWYRHQAFCYYVETQASNFKTWSLAQDFCNSVHGNLASIDSEGTNDFLTVMVAQSVNRETWIGLWKNDVNGKFKWKDGSSVQFAAWHPGTSISKSCIMIKNDGLWIDGHCNSKGPFICKRPLVPYTTNTTVLPSTSAASSGGCEVGYWQFGSKCYGISDPSGPLMTSDLAFANCRRQRGELLTIDSVDEQVFVSSILIGQHHGVWTSMTRWSDGAFKWGGQRVVHFTNWAPGEPSYTRAGMSHENCVELLIRPDMLGRWNDVSCDAERGYICTKALDSSLPPQTAAPSECPHGYSGFTDTCIRHVTSSKQGFVDSQRVCAELGGRVMTVDSEAYNPYSLLKSLSSEGQVWVNYAKNSGSGCFVQTVDTIKQNLKGCTEALTVLCETERLGRTTTPKPTIPPNTTTCHGEHSVRIEQRCFALFKTKLQFHVTLEACTKLGMAPASIHSDTQNQQLIDWINTQNMSLSEFWIGLMDMFGQPLWIDSTSMDYRGAMVMVNYYGSSYVLEKCGYVTTGQYSWFITSDCTEERAFLCADITGDNNGTFVPEEITSSYIYSEETSSVDTSDDARPTYYPINRRYHGGPPDSKAAAPSSLSAGQIAAWVIGACALVACIGAVVYRLRCSSLKAKLLSATKRSDLGFDNALFQKDGDETVMLE